jgi:hypothetical protein
MGAHSNLPANEPVKLFGRVIHQASSPQASKAIRAPASPCSDGSDTEIWRPEQPRDVQWPGCQPPLTHHQTSAWAPAGGLRSDSVSAMQDAAATLSELGSCRSAPPATPAQPVAKPIVTPRRRPSSGTSALLPPSMKACSSCREVGTIAVQDAGIGG